MIVKRYGLWEGVVVDNDDPQYRNRVRVRIKSVYGDAADPRNSTADRNLPWAQIAGPPLGFGQGPLPTIQVGTQVLVSFINGQADYPVVVGSWLTSQSPYNDGDLPNAASESYTAGDDEKVVEGNKVEHAVGNRSVSATGHITSEATGNMTRRALNMTDVATGARAVTAASESTEIKGDSSKRVFGSTLLKFLKDVSVGVVGAVNVGVSDALDAIFVQGVSVKTYLANIDLQTMFAEGILRTMDAAGLVELSGFHSEPSGRAVVVAVATVHLGDGTAAIPVSLQPIVDSNFTLAATYFGLIDAQLKSLGLPGIPTPTFEPTPSTTTFTRS